MHSYLTRHNLEMVFTNDGTLKTSGALRQFEDVIR